MEIAPKSSPRTCECLAHVLSMCPSLIQAFQKLVKHVKLYKQCQANICRRPPGNRMEKPRFHLDPLTKPYQTAPSAKQGPELCMPWWIFKAAAASRDITSAPSWVFLGPKFGTPKIQAVEMVKKIGIKSGDKWGVPHFWDKARSTSPPSIPPCCSHIFFESLNPAKLQHLASQ